MIEPLRIPNRGEMALCKCDACAAEELVPAAHGDSLPGGSKPRLVLRNPGQVITKLQGKGWVLRKRKLFCPTCAVRGKPAWIAAAEEIHEQEGNMTAKAKTETADLRQPTREQKREIIQMLEVAYDTAASRYKGADTDKTVADAIGGGILPGWVSAIREDLFGPDGGNDELVAVKAELAAKISEIGGLIGQIEDLQDHLAGKLRAIDTWKGEAEEWARNANSLHKRVDAIAAAVGPKAGAR